VTFGAFVEILDGVEGLVHISELANHHVENPREVVQPGDDVRVRILEIDSDRRRLSLSVKRVEGQVLPRRDLGAGDLDDVPELGLSDDVFAGDSTGDYDAPAAADDVPPAAADDVPPGAADDVPPAAADEAPPAAADEAPPAAADEAPAAAADEAPTAAADEAPAAAGDAPAADDQPPTG
jgi:small subunit ribosomal protein S1